MAEAPDLIIGIDAGTSMTAGVGVGCSELGETGPVTRKIPSHSEQNRHSAAPAVAESSVSGSMGLRQWGQRIREGMAVQR